MKGEIDGGFAALARRDASAKQYWNRLEHIPESNELRGKHVLVTGCGYRERKHIFYDHEQTTQPTHDSFIIEGEHPRDYKEMKLNIGAATAGVLALKGATVTLVSRNAEKLEDIIAGLESIRKGISEQLHSCAANLLEPKDVHNIVATFDDKRLDAWVQSIGLGAGSYTVPDDNPYLHLEEIPVEFLEEEARIVLRGTHLLMRELLMHSAFKPTEEYIHPYRKNHRNIVIVSSMSAIRGYSLGSAHCAAKAALSRYTNSAMIDLWRKRIYVTDVRPGAVDTGMYDGKKVRDAVKKVFAEYGGRDQANPEPPLMPPTAVGQVIASVLSVPAHIPSINLVAKGQFPHEGS